MTAYLIDSDVLITAKNRYYSFPICPGFWESILYGYSRGYIYSIDRVKQELLLGRRDDDLVQWVGQSVPTGFFLDSTLEEIVTNFTDVMLWVMRHAQYYEEAKAKFASGADGWLVAYSMASGKTIVTNEQSRPDSRNQIKLPDVCNEFSVDFEDTFTMLYKLGIQYHFSPDL